MTPDADEALLEQLGGLAREEQKLGALSDISESTVSATAARVLTAMERERRIGSRISEHLRRLKERLRAAWLLPLALATASTLYLAQRAPAPSYELSVLHAGGGLRGDVERPELLLRSGGAAELLLRPRERAGRASGVQVWREDTHGVAAWPAAMELDASGAVRLSVELPADTRRVIVGMCGDARTPEACDGQRWSLPVLVE